MNATWLVEGREIRATNKHFYEHKTTGERWTYSLQFMIIRSKISNQSQPACIKHRMQSNFRSWIILISPFQNYLSDMTFMAAEVLPQTLHNKIFIVMVISVIHVV